MQQNSEFKTQSLYSYLVLPMLLYSLAILCGSCKPHNTPDGPVTDTVTVTIVEHDTVTVTQLDTVTIIERDTVMVEMPNDDDQPWIINPPTVPVAAPVWQVTGNDGWSTSMTIVATVPYEISISSGDQMAAFIHGECHGVATRIGTNFYLSVAAEAAEDRDVDIRYWNAKTKLLYHLQQPMHFLPDARLGTTDVPYILRLSGL